MTSVPDLELRAVATLLHALPGAVGELSWDDDNPPLFVGAGVAYRLQPCQLRAAVGHALAGRTMEGLRFAVDRPSQPTARLLPSSFCHPLGLGIYRIVLPCQVMIVFCCTLGAAAVGEAASAAKTELAGMGACDLDVGVLRDELTAVSLVSLRQPRNDKHDTGSRLLDAVLVLAGACTAAEAALERAL